MTRGKITILTLSDLFTDPVPLDKHDFSRERLSKMEWLLDETQLLVNEQGIRGRKTDLDVNIVLPVTLYALNNQIWMGNMPQYGCSLSGCQTVLKRVSGVESN